MKRIVEAVIILIMVFVYAGIGYAQVDELKDG
ncbi:unnamed protein product, partial [marine sediment metagenome]